MIYWFILILILISLFLIKKTSEFFLKIAMFIFVIGAIMRLIHFIDIAETLMRIDFIFWLVGFFVTIKEDKFEDES